MHEFDRSSMGGGLHPSYHNPYTNLTFLYNEEGDLLDVVEILRYYEDLLDEIKRILKKKSVLRKQLYPQIEKITNVMFDVWESFKRILHETSDKDDYYHLTVRQKYDHYSHVIRYIDDILYNYFYRYCRLYVCYSEYNTNNWKIVELLFRYRLLWLIHKITRWISYINIAQYRKLEIDFMYKMYLKDIECDQRKGFCYSIEYDNRYDYGIQQGWDIEYLTKRIKDDIPHNFIIKREIIRIFYKQYGKFIVHYYFRDQDRTNLDLGMELMANNRFMVSSINNENCNGIIHGKIHFQINRFTFAQYELYRDIIVQFVLKKLGETLYPKPIYTSIIGYRELKSDVSYVLFHFQFTNDKNDLIQGNPIPMLNSMTILL